jgi:hypothetical protein
VHETKKVLWEGPMPDVDMGMVVTAHGVHHDWQYHRNSHNKNRNDEKQPY